MPARAEALVAGALAVAALLYPVLVYLGMRSLSPRLIALALAAIVLVRLLVTRGDRFRPRLLWPVIVLAVLCGGALLLNRAIFVLLVPALINASLLVSFAMTLWRPPSMVEVFARMQVAELSDEEVRYCRSVTVVWCVFFAGNGAVAALASFRGDLAWWSLYNGLLAYIAMGLLFAAEITYRYWRFRRYEGSVTDLLFRKIFPPRTPQ